MELMRRCDENNRKPHDGLHYPATVLTGDQGVGEKTREEKEKNPDRRSVN